ncbi:MAG TPA: cytochrome P460 family protein [Candidatus Sulfotelmatobacter sp.]|jgi:hypothetical protein|nr:cytochrome P460 family protein [Candidatus Sulfotelmatobacter sp.]
MTFRRIVFFVLQILIIPSVFAEKTPAPTDEKLVLFVQQRTNAVKITQSPFEMGQFVVARCVGPSPEEVHTAEKEKTFGISDPHLKKFVHVYVSHDGQAAMRTDSGVFPQGAIVLKEKFSDPEGKHTELFTGMIKREAGYNPECGDWEFFTLPGDASQISSRGKLQDCMDCHVEYKKSDYVTKNYAHISFYPKPTGQ